MDRQMRQSLDNYITGHDGEDQFHDDDGEEQTSAFAPNELPSDPFPNRLTDEQADALGFRHLKHILDFHGPVELDTDNDETGQSFSLTVKGDRQFSKDLLDLLSIESEWLCREHVEQCTDLAMPWGCEQTFCHRNVNAAVTP